MDIEFIKVIEGEILRDVGRASDMLWLSIGDRIKVLNQKGIEIEKGKYALHMQIPWRITDENTGNIVIASGDIYEPRRNIDWTDNFEWDIKGNNLFDEKIEVWKKNQKIVKVQTIQISLQGDIEIKFLNKFVLNGFMNVSTDEEGWRFFKCNSKDEHMIATGERIKFE